jgi:hypothetical protein
MFLRAAIVRVPEKIAEAKKIGTKHLVRVLEQDPEEYLSRKGDAHEATFLEWVKNNRPEVFANVGLSHHTHFLTDRKYFGPYMQLPWLVYGVEDASVELLLGDRPIWTHKHPSQPDFMAVMPLSPRSVFIAAKSDQLIQRLTGEAANTVARRVNESIVQQARLRVYGRAKDCFIDRCMREPGGIDTVV